jgi:hypothetical protein
MKIILPFSLLLLFCLNAFGQSKFQRGYYVTFAGDSVQCYIKNDDWIRNPGFIEVKSSMESAASEKLSKNKVQRFGFEGGDLYETYVVEVDTSPLEIDKLQIGATPTSIRDTVMLRALVKGPLNLYVYTDQTAKVHFYAGRRGEEPVELGYRKAKVVQKGQLGVITHELYKDQLKVYMEGCEQVKNRINKTEFKQTYLRELVLTYNACVAPEEAGFKAEKEKGRFMVGVSGGFTAMGYNFEDDLSFKELVHSDFNGQSATLGLVANYVLPRAHGRLIFVNELMLKPYTTKGRYESTGHTYAAYTYNTEFKLVYAGLHNLVRYALSAGNVRPFLNLGMGNSLLVSDKSRQSTEIARFGNVEQKEGPPIDDMRKYEQSILVGAGVSAGKLTAEARLEKGNGFSKYTGLRSIKTAYTLQLTYFIR